MLTQDDIARTVASLSSAYGVEKATLFGSYARGEQVQGSDVDVMIEKGALRGLEVFAFQNELAKALGSDVDLLTSGGVSPQLAAHIEKDGIVVYEHHE